jgi:predicted enzyme related to lactoylglutathione lyase
MHGEVVHFEVPAKDVKRAKAFYSQVFGWKTNDTKMPSGDTYTSLMTTETDEQMRRPKAPGAINGGMMQLREPYTGPVVTIQVDDITGALKSVESQGGKTIVKRTDMGQYGAYGYFKDPEGNLMGLFEVPRM